MADNSSSNESSSSDYTTDSSDEDGMETAQINGVKVQLPQGLCERLDIFKEFFSVDVWNSLSDHHQQHLQTFLPNFPENDDLEKAKTLQRLFDFETFKFSNPLIEFQQYLKAGYFRPDIAKMRQIIHKTEKKEAKYRYRSFREQLKHEVIESQEKLLSQVRNLPPRFEPKQEKRKLNVDYVSHRTKKRYFQILSSIHSKTEDTDCSSDENYPEGPPPPLSRKQKRHLNSIRNNLNSSKEKMFGSTMVAKLNGFSIELEKYITPHHNPFYINDESYKNMLYYHKKRKLENPAEPELYARDITMTDVISRTQLPYFKTIPAKVSHPETKSRKRLKREHTICRKSSDVNFHKFSNQTFPHSSNSDSDSDSVIDAVTVTSSRKGKPHRVPKPEPRVPTPKPSQEIKKEPETEPVKPVVCYSNSPPSVSTADGSSNLVKSEYINASQIKVENVESMDIISTPVELENAEIDIMDFTVKPELMQETHANFFSLIRDVICSTNEHRMNMYMLQERLKAWQENPISPLNDWYCYTDNWISILPSAITFLCGNASDQPDDFVPYMEYKISMDVYQWIGAGRDSDPLLSSLCHFWLEHRTESKLMSPNEIDVDVIDRDSTPPPPRFPTTWTVRKATAEEIKDYREQERKRYDNPHKAFTYRCNGYESVVGPLKGMYNPAVGNTKARGHTMLNADRPNFVTILSLVRDATARLPNGEGTRADICELLKSSQYISSSAPDNILQSVVSGALDRMHTQWDPCVRYDQKKKIWIYLHRHRTEDDFERIHQQYQGVHKTKKSSSKKSPPKPKAPKTEKTVKTVKLETSVQPPLVSQPQETTPSKPKPIRRHSVLQTQEPQAVPEEKLISLSPPNLVPTTPKNTSLLLSNNVTKQEKKLVMKLALKEEAGVPEPRVGSPTVRTSKNQMVKMLSPSHGKSLILPTSNPQIVKQIQERAAPSKHISQVVTQQLLQTIAAQQKQLLVQKNASMSENSNVSDSKPEKLKVPPNLQQQIVGISPQQLQNIKNVTLLRPSSNQNIGLTPISSISQNIDSGISQNIVTVAVSKQPSHSDEMTPGVQIKTHGNLTPAQQQQILQTIKQKILPNANVLTHQQQVILKQKVGLMQLQKQGAAIGGSKINTEITKPVSTSPGPVVAKVLTNAAGQVISVESLLAHQKQHGSLPQGTTLRVQGSKGGQQNIIQLTNSTTSKSNAVAQFAVGSQNNILTLTTQPKLAACQTTAATSSSIASKPKAVSRTQQLSKFSPKVTQQLINARIISPTVDGQKLVQSKVVVGQQNSTVKFPVKNSSKSVALSMGTNANTIRMVNATNLNLTTIGGKPVLLASKGGALQNLQGQNVILQAQSNSGGPSLVLQNSGKLPVSSSTQAAGGNINILNQQGNIVFSPQVKTQVPQQVVFTSGKNSIVQSQGQGQVLLGGQPLRLTTSNASSTQRLVLASQGQGGQIVAQQILLPAGFQGTAINIKAFQGVKVIPIAQAQGKGGQTRQVFARVMSPNLVNQSTSQVNKVPDNAPLSTSGSE